MSNEIATWFSNDCDNLLLRTHDLNSNSLVVDIGCHTCVWLNDITRKYNCFGLGIEPLKIYFQEGKKVVSDKVELFNYGITIDPNQKYAKMNVLGDTSKISETGENVELVYAIDFFRKIYKPIDVLQINIEGYEYVLLPFLIDNNLLYNVKNIQIQFHKTDDYSEEKMNNIIKKIENLNFNTKFNYKFVWYGAYRK